MRNEPCPVVERLIQALTVSLPAELVCHLMEHFLALRQDVLTRTLGRSAPGKFVETLVQMLQHLETGRYEATPKVDEYLRNLDSRGLSLDDGLRVCAARVGRAMYTLRNKRGIAHKGEVDPNTYDLAFLYAAAQWVLAELVRSVAHISMQDAGSLIQYIGAPAGTLVEDFADRRVVLKDLTIKEEILVLLHSYYPELTSSQAIVSCLHRRTRKAVGNSLRALWSAKLVERDDGNGYALTARGFADATAVVARCTEAAEPNRTAND